MSWADAPGELRFLQIARRKDARSAAWRHGTGDARGLRGGESKFEMKLLCTYNKMHIVDTANV